MAEQCNEVTVLQIIKATTISPRRFIWLLVSCPQGVCSMCGYQDKNKAISLMVFLTVVLLSRVIVTYAVI